MRIAVVGSHATGKSTLIQELHRRVDGYASIPEAYHLASDAGQSFGDPPTVHDYVTLAEYAASLVHDPTEPRALFDRSPLDYLAYAAALDSSSITREMFATAKAAMASLDFVAFVPVETPDRIAVDELPRLRRRVDRLLYKILIEDTWSLSLDVLEVRGSILERVDAVLDRIERG